jgi:hypothetical protein
LLIDELVPSGIVIPPEPQRITHRYNGHTKSPTDATEPSLGIKSLNQAHMGTRKLLQTLPGKDILLGSFDNCCQLFLEALRL